MTYSSKIAVAVIVVGFIVTLLAFIKPHSAGVKLIRKLCFVHAAGWLVILLFSSEGHPPGFLIPLILFWLLNLVLLPAVSTA
jgi:hypothetical protein